MALILPEMAIKEDSIMDGCWKSLIVKGMVYNMNNQKHVHLDFLSGANRSCASREDGPRQEEYYEFDLKDFLPEIYDCEADGNCGSGHQHLIIHPN